MCVLAGLALTSGTLVSRAGGVCIYLWEAKTSACSLAPHQPMRWHNQSSVVTSGIISGRLALLDPHTDRNTHTHGGPQTPGRVLGTLCNTVARDRNPFSTWSADGGNYQDPVTLSFSVWAEKTHNDTHTHTHTRMRWHPNENNCSSVAK